jgi:hypothetical protein
LRSGQRIRDALPAVRLRPIVVTGRVPRRLIRDGAGMPRKPLAVSTRRLEPAGGKGVETLTALSMHRTRA